MWLHPNSQSFCCKHLVYATSPGSIVELVELGGLVATSPLPCTVKHTSLYSILYGYVIFVFLFHKQNILMKMGLGDFLNQNPISTHTFCRKPNYWTFLRARVIMTSLKVNTGLWTNLTSMFKGDDAQLHIGTKINIKGWFSLKLGVNHPSFASFAL